MSNDSRQRSQIAIGAIISLVAIIAVIVVVLTNRQQTMVMNVGRVEDFAPGSVTEIELKTSFDDLLLGEERSPVPIFLVNDPNGGLLALYNRHPHLGCRVTWMAAEQRFLNPCHGEKYTLTGEYIEGPAPHGLDRFGVTVTDKGKVVVDVDAYQTGPPRQ